MKTILKLEQLGLMLLFSAVYFHLYPGQWILFAALFFAPDIAIAGYLVSSRFGAIVYNFLHHKGVMALVIILGFIVNHELMIKIGLIFLAHSAFDRIFGFGLKYADDFKHTHLGWIQEVKSEK